MEFAPGKTLYTFITELMQKTKGGKLAEDATLDILKHVASALEYMHKRGIVCRDLKQENIMVHHSVDGKLISVKIFDFGLSTMPDKDDNNFGGTLEYVAPEMIEYLRADTQPAPIFRPGLDMWALGILMYELLSGTSPFAQRKGDTEEDRYTRIENVQYERGPIEDNQDISEKAKSLIKGLLTKKPEERLSASDFLVGGYKRWYGKRQRKKDGPFFYEDEQHKIHLRKRSFDVICRGLSSLNDTVVEKIIEELHHLKVSTPVLMSQHPCIKGKLLEQTTIGKAIDNGTTVLAYFYKDNDKIYFNLGDNTIPESKFNPEPQFLRFKSREAKNLMALLAHKRMTTGHIEQHPFLNGGKLVPGGSGHKVKFTKFKSDENAKDAFFTLKTIVSFV